MQEHKLKLLSQYYKDVESNIKTFEVRYNDRDFKVGDTLVLMEYVQDVILPYYTGKKLTREVCYVLQGGNYGLANGYVILGIK